MELENLDNNKTSFPENLEIIPITSKKNSYKIILYLTIIIIIILIFGFIFFVIFPKNKKYNNNNIKLSRLNDEISEEKHIDLNYERISPNDEKYIYIPIVGTNDFHGRFFPQINEINYNSKKIKYKTGGLEYIAKYINIIRDEFGKNRVLYFDLGDQFFLKNETILFNGENILDFLNEIGVNGTVLGNHEFLYKREWIENKIKRAKYPYIINNIQDKITNKKKGALGENQETSHLYEIKLDNGDIIKIGVIGITLNNGVDKRFYNVGNKYTWNNITFQSYETDLEKESNKLKEKGANSIILLSHIGLLCNNLSETARINMYNKTIKQSECEHEGNSLLYNFLNKTKPGLFDAIIGGDTHNTIHHWMNDIPIMITKGRSNYLNIMYLPFKKDTKNNIYKLINEEIKIEGPLPSCEKIFSNLNHCEKLNTEEEYINSGELIDYFWHGKKIEKDNMTKKIFDKYYSLYKIAEQKEIVRFIGFNNSIKLDLKGDSLLGNFMMDAIRNLTKTDISIVNYFMFQNELSPGALNILDFIKLFPRDNFLCTTELTGEELIKIIKCAQIGKKGFHPTSGLKQTIKIKNKEIKEVINVEIYKDGKAIDIDKNKTYKISSNNVVLSEDSKDEFAVKESLDIIQNKYKNNKIKCLENTVYIELSNYFKNKGIVDLSKEVDMTKPRIVVIEE